MKRIKEADSTEEKEETLKDHEYRAVVSLYYLYPNLGH